MSNNVYVVKVLANGTLLSSTLLPSPSANGGFNTIAYVQARG